MENKPVKSFFTGICIIFLFSTQQSIGQKTQIKGFVDALSTIETGKLSFGFGEQDLFITSELNDRFSFLGESVFKFSLASPTSFDVSIERIVMKYNFSGNNNLLIGKHHTPLNYWNDTYHHGRVFFPTIDRPLLFEAEIIPLHTTGVSLQGQNLGDLKFGYDLMVGNGLGSMDIKDNDKYKSLTAAVHIKPAEHLRIGASYYRDIISKGAQIHDHIIIKKINQHLWTGSVAYFGKKFELLTESTYASNHNDSTGTPHTIASYLYAGLKIKDKYIPYVRLDNIHYQAGELFFHNNFNTTSIVGGFRYEINYLAVIKLEYQYIHRQTIGYVDKLTAQLAIGF